MMTETAFAIPKSGVSWRRASGEALPLPVKDVIKNGMPVIRMRFLVGFA